MRSLSIILALGQIITLQAVAGIDVSAELRSAPAAKKEAGEASAKGGGQEKVLNIIVHNSSNKPEPGLSVRYWYFGRDMKTMKVDVVGGGESSVSLKPNGSEAIAGSSVQSSYTPKSSFLAKPAGAKAAPMPAGKAPETKIAGYGVQVIKEGKVVAETFLELSHKAVVGSEGSKPGTVFTPKEVP